MNVELESKIKKLERESRILKKKLNRSEENREIIEEAKDRFDHLYKSVIDELNEQKALLAQREKQFRALVESAPDATIITDDDGIIRMVNNEALNLFGYSSEELIGVKIEMLMPERFRDSHVIHRNRFVEERNLRIVSTLQEQLGLTKSGLEFHVEVNLSLIETEQETLIYSAIRDITDRKLAEDRLAEANRHLRELDRMKSMFLSSVSHELRTPLTSILGFAKLIQRNFIKWFIPLLESDAKLAAKSKKIVQNLDVIRQEGERLTRLINDVLDLSKIESGRTEWRNSVFPVTEAVQQAVRSASGQFADKPSISLHVFADIKPQVHADQDRIVQVLINLLNNAAKFTHEGSVTVKVAEDGNDSVRIDVSDTGDGIPADEVEKVFDQFHQVTQEDTLHKKPKGTGLGLAICKQIVDHYKGRIWAESELGQGSTFSVVLPILPEGIDQSTL
ncbi:PAS domain-containing sensor histidine kinase [Desulfobacterales bacterium HSG17]|nr:PAS domain-containing sensor histidine kinase [Desulfobacterales bacterium HSG17]